MLISTLKALLLKPGKEKPEPPEIQVLKLLKAKMPEEAYAVLNKHIPIDQATPTILALYAEVEAHRKNHQEAERLALEALKKHPDLAGGHYVLSMVYYEWKRHEEATVQAMCAKSRAGNVARYLAQLGLCCIAIHDYGKARQSLRQAVLLEPDNVPAINNLGVAHYATQDIPDALYCFQRALALQPDYTEALLNLSKLQDTSQPVSGETPDLSSPPLPPIPRNLYSEGDDKRIREEMEARINENPNDANTLKDLIEHCIKTHNLTSAFDTIQLALARTPDNPDVLVISGNFERILGNFNQAYEQYSKAVSIDPSHAKAQLGLGLALRDMHRVEESLEPLSKAAQLDQSADTLFLHVQSLANACHYEEALAAADNLSQKHPQTETHLHAIRSLSHAYLGNFQEALKHLKIIKDKYSHNPSYIAFRGLMDLLHEDYENGWDEYRYRLLNISHGSRLTPYPLWDNEPLDGKTILVTAEQGLGDQVMFASCIPDLLNKNPARVIIETEKRITKTLARSFPQTQVLPSNQTDFSWLPHDLRPDFCVHIADLPRFFRRSIDSFPPHSSYLTPDQSRVVFWRNRLALLDDKPKIGISWRGGVQSTRRAIRSLQLQQLDALLSNTNAHFVNLQYGDVSIEIDDYQSNTGHKITNWPEAIKDLDEFSALICALDLVITVCNTTVHFTGALGKPCWVLTPFVPEWRYGLTSASMRWYPSTRMFRQPVMGDWESVITQVSQALKSHNFRAQ